MLNALWLGFFIVAGVSAFGRWLFAGDAAVFSAMVESLFGMAKLSVDVMILLFGTLTLWLGILRIAEKAGLVEMLARLLSPLFRRLMPDVPAPSTPSKSAKEKSDKKSKTQIAEEELTQLIQFRQAKTKALTTDPSFEREYHDANASHTDVEKRAALKKYYTRLYGRIRKIDPRVKKLVQLLRGPEVRKYVQDKYKGSVLMAS